MARQRQCRNQVKLSIVRDLISLFGQSRRAFDADHSCRDKKINSLLDFFAFYFFAGFLIFWISAQVNVGAPRDVRRFMRFRVVQVIPGSAIVDTIGRHITEIRNKDLKRYDQIIDTLAEYDLAKGDTFQIFTDKGNDIGVYFTTTRRGGMSSSSYSGQGSLMDQLFALFLRGGTSPPDDDKTPRRRRRTLWAPICDFGPLRSLGPMAPPRRTSWFRFFS